jgi:hypothetical protein
MKSSHYPGLLALLALVPLGCGGEMPAANAPSAVAPTQRPAEVTVVDLTPPAPTTPVPEKAPVVDPEAQRQSALKEAAEYGMMGVLGGNGDPNAPSAPWGKDDAGTDPSSAQGNMWGASVGDSFGKGGLGLSGLGASAGGTGQGIGIGSIGTIGHGAGTGTGQGFGSGSGRLGGARSGNPPKVKMGATTVSGRLPPEVVQRIVRQNFGRFRLCYENGLRTNPKLEGKVVIRFEIDKLGAVSTVAVVKDTTMPDRAVSACIERAFHGLSFPQPEGGKVVVVYPILFEPGEPAPKAPPAAPTAAPAPTPAPAPVPATAPAPKSP